MFADDILATEDKEVAVTAKLQQAVPYNGKKVQLKQISQSLIFPPHAERYSQSQ
mgnify:CR=1 FL=1